MLRLPQEVLVACDEVCGITSRGLGDYLKVALSDACRVSVILERLHSFAPRRFGWLNSAELSEFGLELLTLGEVIRQFDVTPRRYLQLHGIGYPVRRECKRGRKVPLLQNVDQDVGVDRNHDPSIVLFELFEERVCRDGSPPGHEGQPCTAATRLLP